MWCLFQNFIFTYFKKETFSRKILNSKVWKDNNIYPIYFLFIFKVCLNNDLFKDQVPFFNETTNIYLMKKK